MQPMITMKTKHGIMSRRAGGALCAVTILILILLGARQASAGWREVDAENAWNDFQGEFQYTWGASYQYEFSTNCVASGGAHQMGFWQEAELIELAVDAYENNPTADNENEVEGLCDGFVALHTDNWSGDTFNDDLCWACIAFLRAYNVTGTTRWLNDAEDNFNTVWTRGEDASDGGIWWTTGKTKKASPSNWTFVIAGHLIYNYAGNGAALSRAQVVYNFCKANLCNSSSGQVYDSVGLPSGTDSREWSYNYGTAVGAASESGDGTFAYNASAWLMLGNAGSSSTINGYTILPNYGQGGTDGGGFNGIVFRWFHTADVHSLIDHTYYIAWAQQNISQAWSERNGTGQSWNNWNAKTSAVSGVFSWDCSDTLSGMLNVPPTN
jgi:hypothetical protein